MKQTKKYLLLGAFAAFSTVPSLFAEESPSEPKPDVEVSVADEPVVEEPSEVEPVVEDSTAGEVVDSGESGGEPEVTICDHEPEQGAICEMEAGEHELRDKDGVMDSDVIFQNTAVDGGLGESADKAAASGSDERGAEIQSKATGETAVQREQKGPVALIKKGRVFLR